MKTSDIDVTVGFTFPNSVSKVCRKSFVNDSRTDEEIHIAVSEEFGEVGSGTTINIAGNRDVIVSTNIPREPITAMAEWGLIVNRGHGTLLA